LQVFLEFSWAAETFLSESVHYGCSPSSCKQGNCWFVFFKLESSWDLTRRYQDCKNDKTSNISLELVDNSPFHLKGSFPGPEDTPYQGGHFEVVSFLYRSHSDLHRRL
jgi:hypothetical protein